MEKLCGYLIPERDIGYLPLGVLHRSVLGKSFYFLSFCCFWLICIVHTLTTRSARWLICPPLLGS